VAVIQISRIQHRRGRENSGSGLPQLASGELGWAVDTQSLYIGNGSVVEGAPAVGNTKIITEHDNIFDLAETYEYRQGDIQTSELSAVRRNLRARLDDRVSVRSFGVQGNGGDVTEALQKALYELYLKYVGTEQTRVVLHVEPGVYTISSTVYIPPYVTLQGAGRDKTVFESTGGINIFETISDNTNYTGVLATTEPFEQPLANYASSARGINLSGFTIRVTTTNPLTKMLVMNSARDCRLTDIKFIGPRLTGPAEDIGIFITSKTDAIQAQFNRIVDCEFVGIGTGIVSNHSIHHNDIEACTFDRMIKGISFGEDPVVGQGNPNDNTIKGCYFEDIDQHGIIILAGTRNLSSQNKFGVSVGNEGGDAGEATHPIIEFAETGNISLDDYFNRTYNLSINQEFIISDTYVPDVKGPAFVDYGFTEKVSVDGSITPNVLFRLPAEATKKYEIEYVYNTDVQGRYFTRSGVLNVVVNRENNGVIITDEYDYIGNDTYAESLEFSAGLVAIAGEYTVQVRHMNTLDTGELTFRISSRS
jgi:hypothetical protein